MYVVFAEERENTTDTKGHLVQTLEQAFAQIVCRCGLAYRFEQEQEGWRLVFTDVERLERSPEIYLGAKKTRSLAWAQEAADGVWSLLELVEQTSYNRIWYDKYGGIGRHDFQKQNGGV
jgi:hypothetical protein